MPLNQLLCQYYKGVQLRLTRMFECHKYFRRFTVKLISFFEKGEGRQPITCYKVVKDSKEKDSVKVRGSCPDMVC